MFGGIGRGGPTSVAVVSSAVNGYWVFLLSSVANVGQVEIFIKFLCNMLRFYGGDSEAWRLIVVLHSSVHIWSISAFRE